VARFLLGESRFLRYTEFLRSTAVVLLKQDNKKLVEVAQSVGYESDAAFSKAFKLLVGVTPGEYRQGAGN
jgi:AraC-like DNA-binding protein